MDAKEGLIGNMHDPQCYGCGLENTKGLKASFSFNEDFGEVDFTYKPQPFQCSMNGVLHGGVLAALLDEAQGSLCWQLGFIVMTDKLELKYHKASFLSNTFRIHAWLTTARKRRLYTRASLKNEKDELLVEAKGTWYILPERLWQRIFSMSEKEREEAQRDCQNKRKRTAFIRRRLRKI